MISALTSDEVHPRDLDRGLTRQGVNLNNSLTSTILIKLFNCLKAWNRIKILLIDFGIDVFGI